MSPILLQWAIAEAAEEQIKEIRQNNLNVMKDDSKITHLKGVDKVINAVGCNLSFDWVSQHWDHGLNTVSTSAARCPYMGKRRFYVNI